jgi:hypothetical protein
MDESGGESIMKTIQTEIPENLYKGAVALAKEGWFGNGNRLLG